MFAKGLTRCPGLCGTVHSIWIKKKKREEKVLQIKSILHSQFFFFLVFGGCTETCTHPRPLLPEAHTFYNTCFQMFT